MNKFTIGALIGWLIGNVPALLATPGKDIEGAAEALREHRESIPDAPTMKVLRDELRRKLFSPRMCLMTAVNLAFAFVALLAIVIGPPRLFGRWFPEAASWELARPDMLVLSVVLLVHVFLTYDKGMSYWTQGVVEWAKARRWIKAHRTTR